MILIFLIKVALKPNFIGSLSEYTYLPFVIWSNKLSLSLNAITAKTASIFLHHTGDQNISFKLHTFIQYTNHVKSKSRGLFFYSIMDKEEKKS